MTSDKPEENTSQVRSGFPVLNAAPALVGDVRGAIFPSDAWLN